MVVNNRGDLSLGTQDIFWLCKIYGVFCPEDFNYEEDLMWKRFILNQRYAVLVWERIRTVWISEDGAGPPREPFYKMKLLTGVSPLLHKLLHSPVAPLSLDEHFTVKRRLHTIMMTRHIDKQPKWVLVLGVVTPPHCTKGGRR